MAKKKETIPVVDASELETIGGTGKTTELSADDVKQYAEPKEDLTTQVYNMTSARDVIDAIRYEIKQHHAENLSKGTVLKVIDKVESEQVK